VAVKSFRMLEKAFSQCSNGYLTNGKDAFTEEGKVWPKKAAATKQANMVALQAKGS
jgi:hypothetical protein